MRIPVNPSCLSLNCVGAAAAKPDPGRDDSAAIYAATITDYIEG